jgi:GNAT superfamily N-acetyltransferase
MRTRTATAEDAAAMARIYVDAWRDTYRGILPADYLARMTVTEASASLAREIRGPASVGVVAEEGDGRVFGFATGGVRKDPGSIYSGEVFTLYVAQDLRGRGAGSRLVAGVVGWLNRMGAFSMRIQVLRDNPYRRFYERRDGVLVGCGGIRFAGRDLAACTFGWIDTDLFLAACPVP